MKRSGGKELIVVAALAAVAGGALWSSLERRGELGLQTVMLNVNSLRTSILASEDTMGQPPSPCGSEKRAREALFVNPEVIGPCGSTYMGREADPGPYWVTVSAGGLDFEVFGLMPEGDEVVVVRATRREPARRLP